MVLVDTLLMLAFFSSNQWEQVIAFPVQQKRCKNVLSSLHVTSSRRISKSTKRDFPSSSVPITENNMKNPFLFRDSFSYHQENDKILSFLPDEGQGLPPITKGLLQIVSTDYIYGALLEEPNFTIQTIFDAIDEEYVSVDVPVVVGNTMFDFSKSNNEDDRLVVEILSFAVLHRIPSNILLFMLESAISDDDDDSEFLATGNTSPLALCKAIFEQKGGWESVHFPKGLGLRMQRRFESSCSERFFPTIKSSFLKGRRRAIQCAADMVDEVNNNAITPEKEVMTPQEFLTSMEKELRTAAVPEPAKAHDVLNKDLQFFPNQNSALLKRLRDVFNNPVLNRIRMACDTQYQNLKKSGRAGFLGYAFINWIMYTFGILWQWNKIPMSIPVTAASRSLQFYSMQKFAKAFAAVYVGGAVLKLPRLVAAVALAPAGNYAMKKTQTKLNVSRNVASVFLLSIMIGTFCGMIGILSVRDMALWGSELL